MVIIMGKTASGKDTIVRELVKRGYRKMVTYTTRPMRKGERQDITYHYISDDEFEDKIAAGFFLEYKSYDAMGGTWYYGSATEDFQDADNKTVVILTPAGYRDFLQQCHGVEHRAIYIYANNHTIRGRLKKRGDAKEEAERRIACDNQDFKDLVNHVDKIIYNNDDKAINDVIEEITSYIEGRG